MLIAMLVINERDAKNEKKPRISQIRPKMPQSSSEEPVKNPKGPKHGSKINQWSQQGLLIISLNSQTTIILTSRREVLRTA